MTCLLLGVAGVAAGAGLWHRVAPELRGGLGYAAKLVCSGSFVSERDPGEILEDLPAHPLTPFLRVSVHEARDEVSVSAFGMARRRAVHREGFGCTLIPPGWSAPMPVGIPPAPGPAAGPTGPQAFEPVDRSEVTAQPGVDRALLEAALDQAFSEPDPDRPRRTRAVVVLHGGQIVAERYASGYGPRTPLAGWSMTKSVWAALVGILVGEGHLSLEDRRLLEVWDDADDPRGDVTLRHLLQMTSGLAFDESYGATGDVGESLFVRADASSLPAARPLEAAPGETWSYASGTSNLLSRIVRQRLGDDARYHDLPRRALFEATGMTGSVIELDANGGFVASSFMYAPARAWARFGQLHLQDGVWEGTRILPEGWTAFVSEPSAASNGRYGAHWHLNTPEGKGTAPPLWPDVPRDAYAALGYEEQIVVVVPSRDAVIARLGLTQHGNFDVNAFLSTVLDALPERPSPPLPGEGGSSP